MINYEQKKKFIVTVLFFALLSTVFFLVAKYAITWLMPFVLATVISLILDPLVLYLNKHFKIKRSFSSFFLVLIFYFIFYTIIYFATSQLLYSIKNFAENNTHLVGDITRLLIGLKDTIIGSSNNAFPELSVVIDNALLGLNSYVGNITNALLGLVGGVIYSVPSLFLSMIITILASFFMLNGLPDIKNFVGKQIPNKQKESIKTVLVNLTSSFKKMGKAYALLLSLTFFELFIAFLIFGFRHALLLAFIIAVIDIMPILGTGTVLVPWSLILFLTGDFRMGMSILVLYAIITVIRQFLEPKVVSSQIGLHPVLTLLMIYLGYVTIGFSGVFLFPIFAIFLKNLNDAGVFTLWNS